MGTPPAPRPAPAHWRPRQGQGEVAGAVIPWGPRLRTLCPRAARHTGSQCSMLRAAALAAAGLGPRLSRRLLSAAAAHAVPAPNPQPEVFYNKVRQPAGPCPSGALFSPGYGACWVGRPQASVYPVGIAGICRSWSLRTPSLPFLRAFWPLGRLSLTARVPLCSWDFVRVLIFVRPPPPVSQRHLPWFHRRPRFLLPDSPRRSSLLVARVSVEPSHHPPKRRLCKPLFTGTFQPFLWSYLFPLDSCPCPRNSRRKNKERSGSFQLNFTSSLREKPRPLGAPSCFPCWPLEKDGGPSPPVQPPRRCLPRSWL